MLAKLFPPPEKGRRRDYRLRVLLLAVAGTALLGYLVSIVPSRGVDTTAIAGGVKQTKRAGLEELGESSADMRRAVAELEPPPAPSELPSNPETARTDGILKEADTLIRAKKFDDAIRTLHAENENLRKNAQAYYLIARALEGKSDYATARDFYAAALDRNPVLADAYYGFATASESLGDLEAALGGMRSFLHLQSKDSQRKLKVVQARSAIWEWESRLGRGVWGPTKGIPPGFSEAELKRDGRGVGIKMLIPGSKQADGSYKYEIKHQDKQTMFEK